VRPDKSSATGNENASRSSSWFRFDDGISVLVHFLYRSLFTLPRGVLCVVSELFWLILVLKKKKIGRKKKSSRRKNEKEPKETRKNQMTNFVVSICCG